MDLPKAARQIILRLLALSLVWPVGTNQQRRCQRQWVNTGKWLEEKLAWWGWGGTSLSRQAHCWHRCGPGPVLGLLSALSHAYPFPGQRCPLCADEGAGIVNGRVRSGFLGVQRVTGSLCVCFSPQAPPARTPSSPRCSGRPVSSVLPATMNSGVRLFGTWTTSSTS